MLSFKDFFLIKHLFQYAKQIVIYQNHKSSVKKKYYALA